MSKYAKRDARHAEIAARCRAGRTELPAGPRCACGAPAVIAVSVWPEPLHFCADHRAEAEVAFETSRP